MFYRVKQFIWAITAPFKRIDEDLLDKFLDKEEKDIFNKLNISDKHHSIRVCENVLKDYKNNSKLDKNKLAKIALLHDVGKSKYKLNVVDKSILVLADKISRGSISQKKDNKKIYAYYNHPKISKEMLINKKYDKDFIEAVEKHHYKYNGENIYLKIIKDCDDKS